MHFRPLC